METELETQEEVNLLQSLLARRLVTDDIYLGYPELRNGLSENQLVMTINLLKRLSDDRWWHRAWTFQEEYLSSTKMSLLIPHIPCLKKTGNFGIIPGEMVVSVSCFREEATWFLLAVEQWAEEEQQLECEKLRTIFGKYNIEYLFVEKAQNRAMSSRIFSDLQMRDITNESDRLPIAANSCDFAIRLPPSLVKEENYSLGLCALAMYLLNGEIFRNDSNIRTMPTAMSLSEYLHYISFERFIPPVEDKELTYLKGCRFYNPSFSRLGVHTEGHLWEITDIIDTNYWELPRGRSQHRPKNRLNDFQRRCLRLLANVISKTDDGNGSLADMLRHHLCSDETVRSTLSLTPSKRHKDRGAKMLVEAIEKGEPLLLASTEWPDSPTGIFVGSLELESRVFTSWHDEEGRDGRRRQTHVSLEVEVDEADNPPILRTVNWANGLVFFTQKEWVEVVFGWPAAWL